MRLPDPARSQVILIGTAEYGAESDLPDLPAVANNLDDLQAALADPTHGWLTPQACTQILDPASPDQLGIAVAERASHADDLVLIYYAGHGLLSPRGDLYLATSRTNRERLRFTAFPYDGIREILNDSPAANRVVILDCCYSGRAIAAMTDPQSTAYDQLDITGTYILTSTTATTTAHAPDGARHTAFTGELITLLQNGDLDSPELITLDHVYRAIYRSLLRQGLPRPQQRGSNATPHLALVRNPAFDAPPPAPERARMAMSADGEESDHQTGRLDTEPEPVAGPAPAAESMPTRRGRVGALTVVATAQLLVAVFGTLAARSSAYLGYHWHLSNATTYWLDLVYALFAVTLMLLAGRLGDVLGHRWLFRAALAILSAAAQLMVSTGNGGLLLAAFAIAGVATAFVTVNGLALLLATFSSALGRAVAVFIAATGGGAAIGVPIAASALYPTAAAWRVPFEVIVALGVVTALMAQVLDKQRALTIGFAPQRLIMPTVGIGLLAFGLLYGDRAAFSGGADTMSSPDAWGPLIAAAAVLVPFAVTRAQSRGNAVPYVMVFLGAALATLTSVMIGEDVLVKLGIVSIYLVLGLGLPVGASLAVVLVGRIDIRAISVLGGLAGAAGPFIPPLAVERGYVAVAFTAFAVGAMGTGAVLYCGTRAALATVDEHARGTAAGVFNVIWLMGGICANAAWAYQNAAVHNGISLNYLLLIAPAMAVVVGLLPLFSQRFRV